MTIEDLHLALRAEEVAFALEARGRNVRQRGLHLARDELVPDERVELQLVRCEVFLDRVRRTRRIRGTHSLVCFLSTLRLRLVDVRLVRKVLVAIELRDHLATRSDRVVGNARRVGTHVGDQTNLTVGARFDTFVQLLRDHHGLARTEAKHRRRLLLQLTGRERRSWATRLRLDFETRELEQLIADLFDDRLRGGLVEVLVDAHVTDALELGREADAIHLEVRGDAPVLFLNERADLFLALDDEPHGHRLNATGGEPLRDLLPEQRRQLVAHDAVEHAASLLRFHLVHVELARLFEGSEDRLLRDLVEHDAEDVRPVGALEFKRFDQVPRNRLPLTVEVGRQVDSGSGLGELLELVDDLVLAADRRVIRPEIVLEVDPELALRQVADVPHRSAHHVVRAQVLVDRPRLGRTLHDDERLSVPLGRLFRLVLLGGSLGGLGRLLLGRLLRGLLGRLLGFAHNSIRGAGSVHRFGEGAINRCGSGGVKSARLAALL